MDKEEREKDATEEAQEMAEEPDHPCLDQNGPLNLLSKSADCPEDPDISLSFNNKGIQRVDNS